MAGITVTANPLAASATLRKTLPPFRDLTAGGPNGNLPVPVFLQNPRADRRMEGFVQSRPNTAVGVASPPVPRLDLRVGSTAGNWGDREPASFCILTWRDVTPKGRPSDARIR